MTPASITTAVGRVCPKCGTNARSGKLSCCAPDGAWFQKCGDSGDPNFEHTWIDGIEACIDFDGESSRKPHGLVVPLQTQNSDKKSTNIRKASVPAQQYFGYSNVYTRVSDTDSNKKLAKVVGFTILLVTILHAEI